MTTIDTTTWEAVVREAEAGIAKWNDAAQKDRQDDVFHVFVRDIAPYQLLVTEHVINGYTERKAIARLSDTGALLSARPVAKKKQVGYSIKPAPVSWDRAVRQGPAAIVKAARLLDYIMVLGSTVTEVRTTTWGEPA